MENLIIQKWSELVLQVRSVLEEYPTLKLTQGRKVAKHILKRICYVIVSVMKMILICFGF